MGFFPFSKIHFLKCLKELNQRENLSKSCPQGYSGSEAWRIFILESRSCPLFLPTVVHALEFSRSPCKWAGKKGLKTQEQSRTKGRISITDSPP